MTDNDMLKRSRECAAVGSAYMGSVRYYAAMLASHSNVVLACEQQLTRRWELNHCRICGPNGVQQLVVPIDKANFNSHTPLRDVVISNHGNWRHLHWGALFSSYGKSPFFDYLADDLERVIRGNQRFLIDLNAELHQVITDFLDLPVACTVADSMPAGAVDLRGCVGGNRGDGSMAGVHDVPYYQQWAARTGFLPDLSIVDMACNLGREAVFTLIEMCKPETAE